MEKLNKVQQLLFEQNLPHKFHKVRRIDRVYGSQRLEYYIDFIRKFLKDRKMMKETISEADYDRIKDSIATTKNKASADELRHKTTAFEDSVKEGLRQYKAELPKGFKMTAEMGGKLLLSVLTAKDGYTDHMIAEFLARDLHTNKDFIKVYGDGLDTAEKITKKKKPHINFSVLKAAVKKHEATKEAEDNIYKTIDEALKNVNGIVPYSEELKVVHRRQTEVIEELHLE